MRDILGTSDGLRQAELALNELYASRLGTIDDTANKYVDILGSENGLQVALDAVNALHQARCELLIGTNPDNPEEATVLPDTAERKAKQLPEPSGYRILCAIPDIDQQYESGLAKSDLTVHPIINMDFATKNHHVRSCFYFRRVIRISSFGPF